MNTGEHDPGRPDPAPGTGALHPDAERALAAMDELLAAVEQMEKVIAVVRNRVPTARNCIAEGLSFVEIVARMDRPVTGEVLYQALTRVETAGMRCRRVLATALRREGQTLQQIADLWGISRQRVSELLQDPDSHSAL